MAEATSGHRGPFVAIALRQQGDSLTVEATWLVEPQSAPAFRLRDAVTGAVVNVHSATKARHSAATIDLRRLASAESIEWLLQVSTEDGSWRSVAGAPTMSADGLMPVAGEDGASAEPVILSRSTFALRTGATVGVQPTLVTEWVRTGAKLDWAGRVMGLDPTCAVSLVVMERTTGVVHRVSLERTIVGPKHGLLIDARLRASVEWSQVAPSLDADWLDFSVEVTAEGREAIRLGLPRPGLRSRVVRRLRPARLVTAQGTVRYFGPFYTFKAHRLAVHVSSLSGQSDAEMRRLRRGLRLRRALRRGAPLWLVGETGYKAQDTGLHFFRYLREHHPEIDARFVIDADAPDRAAAEAAGPVLLHGSPEHVRAVLLADRIIGSHHPDYLYPIRTTEFKKSVRAVKVFLQHGVLGTKWIANLYGNGRGGFETDAFFVSSPFEKRIVVRDFGYPAKRVVVTGLPRFDSLLAPSEPSPILLVIPTWRDWVRTREDFESSEFLAQWRGLIASDEFKAAVKQAGWKVRLILHPNFRQYAAEFEDEGVEVLRQGEQSVQSMLRESAVLLTDYSSVAFDFALLGRPVVYFQFDRPRFLGAEGSHMDLDRVLPGFIEFGASGVTDVLSRLAEDATLPDAVVAKARRFFPAMDRHSNERVFAATVSARRTRRWSALRRVRELFTLVYHRFRYSRFYAPYVKAIYRTARMLPLDHNRVLFECGLGKRYGDSPKAIYDSLCGSHPQLRKTWVLSGPVLDGDDHTDSVERLTARYFVALARSRYLVSNQSFPHYIRRRSGQVFVQTWHGTPLKRMARDQLKVVGRDEGYVERATTAAAQWSVLVSPNRFATEVMASAFGFKGKVLEVGYPRNDVLHGERAATAARSVRRAYGIAADRKLVLFAPTFRDRALDRDAPVAATASIGLGAWLDELGQECILLIRRHVLDTDEAPLPEGSEGAILDVTDYPDVQELLAAADVLVTDYSSLFFDYLNLRRPIVFFAPDLSDYGDVVRGFYLDYERDLPGPIATDPARARALVSQALSAGTFEGYDLDGFAERYCPRDDGSAADRVVAAVFDGTER